MTMPTRDDLERLYAQLRLGPEALELIRRIRSGEPERRVEGSWSVTGRFASRKMAKSIQYESRTLEGPACWLYEWDEEVAEFFDQPTTLWLSYRKGSRTVSCSYVPDFFVSRISNRGVVQCLELCFEEWRPKERLLKLQDKRPERYRQQPDGKWVDLAAQEHLRRLGLKHVICTEDDIPAVLVRNIRFLHEYRPDERLEGPLRKAAIEAVAKNLAITG